MLVRNVLHKGCISLEISHGTLLLDGKNNLTGLMIVRDIFHRKLQLAGKISRGGCS